MQKIEKWRVQELILVLENLVDILRKSDHREWANVFAHYHLEAQGILLSRKFHQEELKKLVRNIASCFLEGDSFRKLHISDTSARAGLNKELMNLRARLYQLLTDLEERFIEYVH